MQIHHNYVRGLPEFHSMIWMKANNRNTQMITRYQYRRLLKQSFRSIFPKKKYNANQTRAIKWTFPYFQKSSMTNKTRALVIDVEHQFARHFEFRWNNSITFTAVIFSAGNISLRTCNVVRALFFQSCLRDLSSLLTQNSQWIYYTVH